MPNHPGLTHENQVMENVLLLENQDTTENEAQIPSVQTSDYNMNSEPREPVRHKRIISEEESRNQKKKHLIVHM